VAVKPKNPWFDEEEDAEEAVAVPVVEQVILGLGEGGGVSVAKAREGSNCRFMAKGGVRPVVTLLQLELPPALVRRR
jgi:hypothetical protein